MLTKKEIKDRLRYIKIDYGDGVIKFVLEKTKLTIPRYLTRELKLKEDGWADHQIRDLAQELETEMAPPTIKYCETPEDYITMYRCGMGSCMRVGSYTHLNGISAQLWNDLKTWPTIWYHYNPYSKGVFTVDSKGKPTSRVFILEDKYFGSAYSDNFSHCDYMKKELETKGYRQTYPNVVIEKEFRVPGVEYKDKWYGPLPHCDDFSKNFGVKFDTNTKEFIYGREGMIVKNTYDFRGWLDHTQVPKL